LPNWRITEDSSFLHQTLDKAKNNSNISSEELESLWIKHHQDNEDELDSQTKSLLEYLEQLKNLEQMCSISKELIRKAGRKWIMSLDPDKYDIGYLFMVEKYGKGFDLSQLYCESGYQEIQKNKLEGLGIFSPFN